MSYTLNKEQAEFIKDLRCSKGYTWRAFAAEFTKEYPDIESETNNQFVGMSLCIHAMELLNETTDQGWN